MALTAGWSTTTATIAASGTTSAAVELGRQRPVALVMPATFTGTAVTFTGCLTESGTFLAVTDDTGTAYSVTVAASKYVALNERKLWGVPFLKVVSGSTEGAERVITIVTMPLSAT